MKKLQHLFIFSLFVGLVIPQLATAQYSFAANLDYEVNKIYPPLSMTKTKLEKANALTDLNKYYKPEWVRKFLSVEVSASVEGKTIKAIAKDDQLTKEQKELMNKADVGSDIAVNVRYIPENTLSHNDPKSINFTFLLNPDQEATYLGGAQGLEQYLKEKAIDKIPADHFQGYALAAVKFIINEEGEIEQPEIFESTKDEEIDQLLLEAISNMPCWKPAEYANGVKVKQEYALTVGNHKSCVINLLNVASSASYRFNE